MIHAEFRNRLSEGYHCAAGAHADKGDSIGPSPASISSRSYAAEASHPPVAAVATAASALNIPEPGGVFPLLSAITPTPSEPKPRLISEAQLAANRANSLKSSGPKTELGLAISSQKRTTHGRARHSGAFPLLTTQDPANFAALKTALEASPRDSLAGRSTLDGGAK
jgi:hypothetical protein